MMSVRDTFYENGDKLTLVIYAKNTVAQDNHVEISGGKQLDVRLPLADGSVYMKTFSFGRWVAAYGAPLHFERKSVPFTCNAYKVEIPLGKFHENGSPDTSVWGNLEQSSRISQPFASSRTLSTEDKWTALEKQEIEERTGIDDLFRKIYADGDDDVKRAMLKSYQTSGGTILSTNWADVNKQ